MSPTPDTDCPRCKGTGYVYVSGAGDILCVCTPLLRPAVKIEVDDSKPPRPIRPNKPKSFA